jgi:predicted DNA-binding protein YlxM (UPF0122 family)
MNENDYKAKNKPAACTRPPWARLVPKSDRGRVLAKIRQETNQHYGQQYDECPKRHVCMGKKCMGRPLPWKSETAKPYLEELKKTHTIKNGELYLNNCEVCPLAQKCSSPCAQVNDFLNRWNKREAEIVYKENIENISDQVKQDKISLPMLEGNEVPWDAISPRKRRVVEKYLYQRKDFLTIANEENLNNQARVKYEYYSALTKLSEYAKMREFIKSNPELTPSQMVLLEEVYINNKTLTQAAKEMNITRQAAQQRLARVMKKYKLSWHKFVRKKKVDNKNKVIYNIPEVLR